MSSPAGLHAPRKRPFASRFSSASIPRAPKPTNLSCKPKYSKKNGNASVTARNPGASASRPNRCSPCRYKNRSVEVLHELDVQAVSAVDIPQKHNRKIALHVILHLNQLLLVRSRIRRIRHSKIPRDLLLNRHARRSVRFRSRPSQERINPKMADPKKMLDAPAHSARNRLRKQRRRPVVRSRRSRTQRALLPSAPQRQQSNNVRIRQRRIRAVPQRKLAGPPRKIDRHQILADRGSRLNVQFRIQLKRVREINVAPRQSERISAKRHLPAQQVNMPEQNRPVPGPAQMQIAINFHLRASPFNPRPRTGMRRHVEGKISHERRRSRSRSRSIRRCPQKRSNVL